jgi:serine/threonine-protein kinase
LNAVNGTQFLTMEYVPGTTLRALIDRQGALPLGAGLQIFKQLASGLQAIHVERIIHRDLKPENVMVLPNGMVKLMDFGVAQLLAELEAGAERGFVAGSPFYMSPEQLLQDALDPRSDLYSLGIIMFEAFTGVHPFHSKTLKEVIRRQVSSEAPRARATNPAVPEALDRLIAACLRKDRAERIESARLLYAGLLKVPAA